MIEVFARVTSYFKTGFRNLLSNLTVSLINIVGLSTGLAAVILIVLFVSDELSYDKWVPNSDRIHRIETTYYPPGRGVLKFALATGPLQPLMKQDLPNMVEASTRIFSRARTLKFEEKQFNESIKWVDKEFFQVFDLDIVAGDRDAALGDINSIALSESMALKYFGDDNPLGKTLTLVGNRNFNVAAIFKDIPENSHLEIDFLTLLDRNAGVNAAVFDMWAGVTIYLYVKTKEGIKTKTFEDELMPLFKRHSISNIPSLKKEDLDSITTMHAIPLPDVHFRSDRRADMKPAGNITTVYSFAMIAGLILLIACINFMNLSTARSGGRAREISMRKVLGAKRKQLVTQFLGETMLLITLSLIIALIVAQLALPYYNNYIAKSLSLAPVFLPMGLTLLFAIVAIVTLGGGLYPALFLSSFKPASILSANQSSSDTSGRFRNILVFFQFAISITLMISTLVVYEQTNYAKNMDLGFNRDQMLVLNGLFRPQTRGKIKTLKTEITALAEVKSATMSSSTPPITGSPNTIVNMPGAAPTDAALVIEQITGDYDYFATMGIDPVAGRLFSLDFPADLLIVPEGDEEAEVKADATQSSVINESSVRIMGFSSNEEALGKEYYSNTQDGRRLVSTIIGIVPDAHYHSIHTDLVPMIFNVSDNELNNLTIQLTGNNIVSTLTAIDNIWKNVSPNSPISRVFMDEDFAAQYVGEEQRGQMFMYFALFAVFVACLGLYGLAAYNAERRTKEIGIHKTMGASDWQIITMLVLQFTKPVLLANIVAWPIAYFVAQDWLTNFTYRVDINPVLFILAGGITLGIAWFTVASHAFKVAKTNPIVALRHD